MRNKLRERIEVRTDGGLRTDGDVVIAACSAPSRSGSGPRRSWRSAAHGEPMAPEQLADGIATQRPDLRRVPWHAGTGHRLLHIRPPKRCAASWRRWAYGGMDDLIGRVELLQRVEHPESPRARLLDLSLLLVPPANASAPRAAPSSGMSARPREPGCRDSGAAALGARDLVDRQSSPHGRRAHRR